MVLQKKKSSQQQPVVKKVYKQKSGNFFGIPTNILVTGGVSISLVASLILIWKVFFSGQKKDETKDPQSQQNSQSLQQPVPQMIINGNQPQQPPVVISKDQFKNLQEGQDHNAIRNRIRNGQIGNFKIPQTNASATIANNVATINRKAMASEVNTPSIAGKEMNANDRSHTIPTTYGDDYYAQINSISSHLPKVNVQDIDPNSGLKPTPRI